MNKKHKILISILLLMVIASGAFCGVFLIKPAIELHQLENLQLEDSPTVDYINVMPDTDEIYGWVQDLTDMGARIPGSDAGRNAQVYVLENFKALGLEDVKVVESITTNWRCNDWSLTVSGTKIPSYYMTHTLNNGTYGTFSTPEGGLNTEIVYVGEGTEADFKKSM